MRPLLPRRWFAALTSAVLALGLAAATAGPAHAADDTGSAVTIALPGFGEGASLTFSKTEGLTDGEQIHVTGQYRTSATLQLRLGEVIGEYLPKVLDQSELAKETADKVLDLGALDPALGTGWWRVDQTFTISRVLTELGTGTTYDGAQQQLYLAIGTQGATEGHPYLGNPGLGDDGTNLIPFTPITFAGGAETLTRYEPAAITTQPADATAAEGGEVTFTVAASGSPAPTYQWYQVDGSGSQTKIAGATDATYTTAGLAVDDGVRFRVQVHNRLGYVFSDLATLTVTTSDEPDGVKYPLYFAGSYLKVSANTGLHDGDTLTVDSFVQASASNMTYWPGTYVTQSAAGAGTTDVFFESRLGILPWTAASNKDAQRNFGHGTYTVHSTLVRDGQTVDCLVTQCYLAVNGDVADADGEYLNPDERPDAATVAASVFHLWPANNKLSKTTEQYRTQYIPLYFDGGTLVPETWVAPSFTTQPTDATVTNGYSATFTTAATGSAAIEYQWQYSPDGGDTWKTILGATSASYQVAGSAENNGWQYRLRARNNGGTTYSQAATLTVEDATGNYDNPDADVSAHGVSLSWSVNKTLQERSPAYYPNYLSAGVSEGSQATYKNADGDVVIGYRDAATGTESVQTYGQRARSNAGAGQQFVRLNNGTVQPQDGGGRISWSGSFSINFYGGLVPFTLTDPTLTWDATGTGTLKADLSGFGSSMDNPTVKVPLEPVADQIVATFSDVRLSSTGVLTLSPDYLGVVVDTQGATPQVTEGDNAGSWPQQFVDFQIKTGLDSYWYSSGSGTQDPKKRPSDIQVNGLQGSGVSAPATVPEQVSTPVVTSPAAGTAVVSLTAPRDGGSPISGYRLTVTGPAGVTQQRETDAATLSGTFSGLTAGDYTVIVTAISAEGSSEPSVPAAFHITAATDPNGPTQPGITAPHPTRAPSVTGTAQVGRTLTAVPGTWSTTGLTFSYQWLRDGKAVAGATARTYRSPRADAGHRVSVRVTAARTGLPSGVATSAATTAIRRAASTVTVKASKKRLASGKSLRIQVTVKAKGLSGITGRVKIAVKAKGSKKIVRTVKVKNGKATLKVKPKVRGRYTIKATYQAATGIAGDSQKATFRVVH